MKNAKVSVKLGNEVMQCIIKEVQKDPIGGQVLHVEMQTVHSDDLVRLKVPVVFYGREKLPGRQQLLQEYISEVEIMGKADIMPEFVSVDVGYKKLGDKITPGDIQVGDGIKVLGNECEVLAVIIGKKNTAKQADHIKGCGNEAPQPLVSGCHQYNRPVPYLGAM